MTALRRELSLVAALILIVLANGAPVDPKEPDPNLTIDELIRNAGIQAEMESVINIANHPSDINNYFRPNLIRPGSVLWDMDMLFTEEQWNEIIADKALGRIKRKAVRHLGYRWPNAEIPYEMRQGQFTSSNQKTIMNAMKEWSRQTCVTFRRAVPADRYKVVYQDGNGCSSYVGRIGGAQPITLAMGCRYHGVITHEIGHAVGFQHEQTRPDREQFVTIHKDNIIASTLGNFRLFNNRQINSYGVPYDYLSVMHYGRRAFSKNGKTTISVKDEAYANKIGNRVGLSFRDIKLANLMYDCAKKSKCGEIKCPGEGFVDKDCNCKCPTESLREPTIKCEPISKMLTTTTKPSPSTTGEEASPQTSKSTAATTTTTTTTTTTPTTATTTTKAPTTTKKIECVDTYTIYCKNWASNDGCTKYKELMERGCKKTCGHCNVLPSVCVDENPSFCPQWRDKGYCTVQHYKSFMESTCQKSCGLCASAFESQGFGETCVDRSEYCPLWKIQYSGCNNTKNWKFMLQYCQKTCNVCRTSNK